MNRFDYFQQELQFLRQSVEDFGRAYPATANELKLSAGRSSDPHVEQLLQSFAYLTGQLRADLTLQRDETVNQTLHALYPNLIQSQPCMTVLQARVSTNGTNFINGYTLEKGKQFNAKAHSLAAEGQRDCYMQCCYHTPLWPFDITDIRILPKNYYADLEASPDVQTVISVEIESQGSDAIREYPLSSLRFYLKNSLHRPALYRLFTTSLSKVAVRVDDHIVTLSDADITWLGFAQDENVLPDSNNEHRAYRLLQEFFSFPDKFYFFDLHGLDMQGVDKHFELIFMFDEPATTLQVTNESFALNCFPSINLFHKTFEPIGLKQTEHEYRVLADAKYYLTHEVHSITDVKSIRYDGTADDVQPWLGARGNDDANKHYITRLVPLLSPGESGCDTFISLYNDAFAVGEYIDQTLSLKGWCNNRRLPEWLRVSHALKPIGTSVANKAVVVEAPTRFLPAKLDDNNNIKLLSQLSLNHISLSNSEESLPALKQILLLYADANNASHTRQIEGLIDWQTTATVKRLGSEAWRGHCRGVKIKLTVDEKFYSDANPLLLGAVLSHFFGLYTSLNHFVQLQLVSHQRDGVWKQWPPRIGEQVLL